ncbi:tetratricopeptide repeat protein [Flavobacterium terrigena]|uniref:Tetratricopeptide repeat-containing protein n=2 Tax=Flavobacterium terrigena TaxID=402734 RepID=A0A1H6QZN1_9FLAO|nr:tetratricopeptide repeat protein [Flavobacterium terrigena]SEI44725.1 Tetratricopeptide repeat-containing protein [Flavobacterium terrigena]
MNMSHEEEEEENNLSLSKFESMLKTNKVFFFDSEEFEDIVLHYMDTGRINLAKKALRLGLEQHPKSTGLKLVHVEILIYDDKIEQAEKILNEIALLEPTNEEVFIQRANICSKRDQHEKAIEHLREALRYTDDEADIYSMIGMEYLFMDNLELAKDNFILCLENDEEDYSALYNVVYCFDFLDQNQEAVEYLENFIDKNPYSEVAWHQLGRQFYALKNYEKAVWAFDYACLIDEGFLGAFLEKAKSLEKLKRYQEAIDCYNITIELDDPTSFAFLRIGKCYEKLGNNEQALNFYLKTVHEDPLLDKAWLAITDFYISQKNYQKSLYYINKAIGIDGENPLYWRRYANINQYLNFFEEAEEGYRKAFENGDVELDNFLCWSDVLYVLGEVSGAFEILNQAKELYPNESEILYRIVGLYYNIDEEFNAIEALNLALLTDFHKNYILKDLFPHVWESENVQKIIKNHNI